MFTVKKVRRDSHSIHISLQSLEFENTILESIGTFKNLKNQILNN